MMSDASWRKGFTEKEILAKRRFLARQWRQKLDMVMDVEAVHFLEKERIEKSISVVASKGTE